MTDTTLQQLSISSEALQEALIQVDNRFESNRSLRKPMEDTWLTNLKAFTQGTAPDARGESLLGAYTNLSDVTLPVALRGNQAYKLSFLETDWFKLRADGIKTTDLQLTSSVEAFLRQKINSRESGFEKAIRNAMFQLECLNISAVQYSWIRKVCPKRYKTIDCSDGIHRFKIQEEAEELVYQGPHINFVNMFNCYPDIVGASSLDNLNDLDLFYREAKSIGDILSDKRFDTEQLYTYSNSLLYRSLDGLEDMIDASYRHTQAERELCGMRGRSSSNLSGYLELRTAYLQELEIPEVGLLQNVCLLYVKADGGRLLPLLLEYNAFDFNRKPIIFMEDWENPFDPYAPGKYSIAANQHFYVVFLKQLKAQTAGKALMPSELIPTNYRKAFAGSDDEFRELYNKPGGQGFYNPDKLLPGKDKIIRLNGSDKAAHDIQIIQAEMNESKGDILQATEQGSPFSGNTATATRNLATQLDILNRFTLRKLSQDLLKPIIEFSLEDLKYLLLDEMITVDLAEGELEQTASTEDMLKDLLEQFRLTGQPIHHEYPACRIPGGKSMINLGVDYNPITWQKSFKLTRSLLHDFRASVEIQIAGNDYSKAHELDKFTSFYSNIIGFVQEEELRALLCKIAIEHLTSIIRHPKASQINASLNKLLEEQNSKNHNLKKEEIMR